MPFGHNSSIGTIKSAALHVLGPDIPEIALNVWLVILGLMVALDEVQNVLDKASVPAADMLDPH